MLDQLSSPRVARPGAPGGGATHVTGAPRPTDLPDGDGRLTAPSPGPRPTGEFAPHE